MNEELTCEATTPDDTPAEPKSKREMDFFDEVLLHQIRFQSQRSGKHYIIQTIETRDGRIRSTCTCYRNHMQGFECSHLTRYREVYKYIVTNPWEDPEWRRW